MRQALAEVGWGDLGFEGAKLGYLVNQNGWFHHGHRAVDDCHALLEVLAAPLPDGTGMTLGRLLHHSTVITIRGDSYRLREKRRSGLLQKAGPAIETSKTAQQ